MMRLGLISIVPDMVRTKFFPACNFLRVMSLCLFDLSKKKLKYMKITLPYCILNNGFKNFESDFDA
jgi:hypothetical protein